MSQTCSLNCQRLTLSFAFFQFLQFLFFLQNFCEDQVIDNLTSFLFEKKVTISLSKPWTHVSFLFLFFFLLWVESYLEFVYSKISTSIQFHLSFFPVVWNWWCVLEPAPSSIYSSCRWCLSSLLFGSQVVCFLGRCRCLMLLMVVASSPIWLNSYVGWCFCCCCCLIQLFLVLLCIKCISCSFWVDGGT